MTNPDKYMVSGIFVEKKTLTSGHEAIRVRHVGVSLCLDLMKMLAGYPLVN